MKKMVLLILLIHFNCFSQAPTIQWQKSFGGSNDDIANSITPTSDGGYIVVGYTYSFDSNFISVHAGTAGDIWVVKLSASGNIQWQKALGGSGFEQANSIQQTTDGGYIVAGSSGSNDGDITSNHGAGDYWIVKLSTTGTIVWQKTLGGSLSDNAYSIQQTIDGGYIVAGSTFSIDGDITGNHGKYDYWVVKLNANGTIQWQKTLGGTNDDFAYSISQNADGGYIVAGQTSSTNGDITVSHGSVDCWIVKLNATGVIQWQKTLGGSGYDIARSAMETKDGGFIIAATTNSTNGDITGSRGGGDYWVVKLDAQGMIQWQKSLGGSRSEDAFSIQQTINGEYIVTGMTGSNNGDVSGNHGPEDFWVVKLSLTGDLIWQKSIGGSAADGGQSVKQTTDGGYILAGYSSSADGDATVNHGNSDYWIVKLAPDTLSTTSFHDDFLGIYPNPATSMLHLQLANGIEINKVIITDLAGKIIREQTINNTKIDIENLAQGAYIIQAFSGDKKFQSKFIKQ